MSNISGGLSTASEDIRSSQGQAIDSDPKGKGKTRSHHNTLAHFVPIHVRKERVDVFGGSRTEIHVIGMLIHIHH